MRPVRTGLIGDTLTQAIRGLSYRVGERPWTEITLSVMHPIVDPGTGGNLRFFVRATVEEEG